MRWVCSRFHGSCLQPVGDRDRVEQACAGRIPGAIHQLQLGQAGLAGQPQARARGPGCSSPAGPASQTTTGSAVEQDRRGRVPPRLSTLAPGRAQRRRLLAVRAGEHRMRPHHVPRGGGQQPGRQPRRGDEQDDRGLVTAVIAGLRGGGRLDRPVLHRARLTEGHRHRRDPALERDQRQLNHPVARVDRHIDAGDRVVERLRYGPGRRRPPRWSTAQGLTSRRGVGRIDAVGHADVVDLLRVGLGRLHRLAGGQGALARLRLRHDLGPARWRPAGSQAARPETSASGASCSQSRAADQVVDHERAIGLLHLVRVLPAAVAWARVDVT